MYSLTPLATTTPPVRNLVSRSPLRRGLLLITLALIWFGLLQTVRAVTPAPDGGYPNGNTAEGTLALNSLTTGQSNTAIGLEALYNTTTGTVNTAIGAGALFINTSGTANTAIGDDALSQNNANDNTATGYLALTSNTTGNDNTAVGSSALEFNSTGSNNTATGFQALFSNTTGAFNTAMGESALATNRTGNSNTAIGTEALFKNTTGGNNTASGFGALFANTTGFNNTASGVSALSNNTTGFNNEVSGVSALFANTTGFNNTANGFTALQNNTTGNSNTADGDGALSGNTTGNNNVAVGNGAGANLTTGSNNIDIGAPGVAAEANTIRIGKSGTQKKTFIAGIRGVTVAGGVGVIVGTTGQLGTVVSSARFKEAIKPMDQASEAILGLQPVTFRYKEELDPDKIPQFGLVAEQVEKVNPDLVVRDEDGKVNTVRYEAVNAMLLNEFLKEHRRVQELKGTVAQQQKQIEALTAIVQKVSDQVEVSKSSPRLIATNQ